MQTNPQQSSVKVSKNQAEKLTQAVLAYHKFIATVRDLRQKEYKLFLDTIKKIEDEKVRQLRKKLATM